MVRSEAERDFDEPMSACPLCSSARVSFFDSDYTGARIDKCLACGVKFMNPQHSDRYLSELYGSYTRLSGQEDEAGADEHSWRKIIHSHYFSLIEQHVGIGKVLSVGSGDGIEIDIARSMGWEVEAYEVDCEVRAFLSDEMGVCTHGGDFAALDCPPESFDCIYLHHVLEHPKRPQDYLKKIYELLKPGGILFVACPNIDSPAARAKTLMGKAHLKKRRGRHYDTWHHLFYYSPSVLNNVLEGQYGFRVVHAGNGLGEQNRGRSDASIKRAIRWDGLLPIWKSVFITLAEKR
ncbi:MAG: class I SAM-dependent methyltransferase [Armatimonadota bacterium]